MLQSAREQQQQEGSPTAVVPDKANQKQQQRTLGTHSAHTSTLAELLTDTGSGSAQHNTHNTPAWHKSTSIG
jgi:sirohydrochlorin ferrochelatase